ncbi:retrovirus-related pol polyprotein from transposon TNT 1-94 [Tanacetum coccineum]
MCRTKTDRVIWHYLLLLLNVNAARHNLLLLLKVNDAWYNLLLLLEVIAARHKLTTAVESEAIYKEMDDSLERAATTATSLDAEHDRGNINKTQSKATLNEPSSLRTSSGSGPKRQDTIGDTIARTRFENASKTSNDSLLAGVNTPRSDKDRLKLNELMEFQKKRGSRTHKLKILYKVGRSARVISSDEASLDDIIFGSTKKSLCTEFEKIMYKKFQMSSMGELTFFLGLQVKQKEDGIFISQDKHNLLLLLKVNSARHNLLLLLKVNAARYNLLLLLEVNAARHKLTTTVENEAIYEEMDDSLERAATTATSLDAKQDRGNINKTYSKATLNEPSSLGISSGSGPKRQDTIGDTIARTRFENVSKTSNDLLLAGVNIPRSDKDRLKLNELMEFFKKLKKKGGSRTHKLKRLYKVGRSARVISSDEASLGDQEDASKQGRKIDDIDKDAKITLVDETQGRYGDDLMFDIDVLDDEEVFAGQDMAEKEINTRFTS